MATINAVGNGLSGTTGSGSFVGGTSPTITTPKIGQINDSNGVKILGFSTVSSAVNAFNIQNQATNNAPSFFVSGSDSNIQMNFSCKGTGGFMFTTTTGVNCLSVTSQSTTAVNYLSINNANTGGSPVLYTSGSDSNIQLNLSCAGTGGINLRNNAGVTLANFTQVASAVNYFQFNNVATGGAPSINAKGSDSNVNVNINPQGTGVVKLNSGVITVPAVSAAASLSLGSAYQNTAGYDVIVTVYLSITAATSASILLGVGSTNTPTQQTILNSFSVTGLISVPIYIPNNYYALLSTSGTISATISGQITMAV